MITVVYISSATLLFSDRELLDLLDAARAKNHRLNVTGMLLYKKGNFMQLLEGPDQPVRELYTKIEQDRRHRGVVKLLEQPITECAFSEWAMAFKNLNVVPPDEVPGYSEFLNEPLDANSFRQDPSRAQRLLMTFRQRM